MAFRAGFYKDLYVLIFSFVPRAPIYRRVSKSFYEILWTPTFLRKWEENFMVKGPHGMTFIAMPIKVYNARHKESCYYNSHYNKFECNCYADEKFKRKIDILIPYSGFRFPDFISCLPYSRNIPVVEYSYGNKVAEYTLYTYIDTDRVPCIGILNFSMWYENSWWMAHYAYTSCGYRCSGPRPFVVRNYTKDMSKKFWVFYPQTEKRLAMWVNRDNRGHLRYYQIENGKVYELSLAGRHRVSPRFKFPSPPHNLRENKMAIKEVIEIAKQIYKGPKSISLYNGDPLWQKIKYYTALLRTRKMETHRFMPWYSSEESDSDSWSEEYDQYEIEMEQEEEEEYLMLDNDIYNENIFEDIELYEDSIDEKYADLINI